MAIGQRGDGEGQFQSPQGLALDAQGDVYVADRGNRRVQVFDPQGGFLMAIVDPRFTGPRYVALDEADRVYVSDASERVEVFDGRGEPLQSFGQAGSLPTQFSQIADLVVDAAGDLYVVDSGNARVQKFSMLRGLLLTFGDVGEEAELLIRPQGIALDAEGNVYVADAQNGRIMKYAPGGSLLRVFETDIGELRDITLDQQGYIYATDAAARVVCVLDGQGRIVAQVGEGQLSDPWGVAVDGDGRVYVADAGHHCVLVLALPGQVPTPGPAPTSVASPAATLSPVEGAAPWPMYGGNAQHTGASAAQGPATANVGWMFRTGLLANSPAIGADGSVYFGSLDGNLYAVDPEGAELWRVPLGQVSGVPALSAEGVIYSGVASPVEEMFYALRRDGSVAWSYHLESLIVESSPVVGPDGIVYLAASNPETGDGSVVALGPDGGERWRYEVGSRLPFSPALGADGTLYVGAKNGNLYALNPDGSLRWQASLGAVSSSVAVGGEGTLYVGTSSEYEALNPTDGGRVWTFSAEPQEKREVHFSSPATIDTAGVLYVGTREGELFAVNLDGSLRWRMFLPEGGMILVGPALGSEGTLYVGAGSNLYAVG
jgi:outer membrane protein assembly factor BamB